MIFGALFQKKQNGTTEAYYCTIFTFRHCELYSFDAATLWSYFIFYFIFLFYKFAINKLTDVKKLNINYTQWLE